MRVPVTEMRNHEEERLWEGAESGKENSINVCMKPLNESILFMLSVSSEFMCFSFQ